MLEQHIGFRIVMEPCMLWDECKCKIIQEWLMLYEYMDITGTLYNLS